jgi:hypothetical protein
MRTQPTSRRRQAGFAIFELLALGLIAYVIFSARSKKKE